MPSICTAPLGILLLGFTVPMLINFLLLSSLNISCFKLHLLPLIPPRCITVKCLLNTFPADSREAALGLLEITLPPDLLSPIPWASPHRAHAPATDDSGSPLDSVCLGHPYIWKIKIRHRNAGNHFLLAADEHIGCPIIFLFPACISRILNVKKISAVSL